MIINPIPGSLEMWTTLVKQQVFWRHYNNADHSRAETDQMTIKKFEDKFVKLKTNDKIISIIPHPFDENWWITADRFTYSKQLHFWIDDIGSGWIIEDKIKLQTIVVWEGNVFN